MLHFTSRAEWEAAEATGEYRPDARTEDGFLHLSFGHQLAWVATARARAASDLVLLVVDPDGLEADLRIEDGFPHLYRSIPVTSVRMVVDMPPGEDGSFEIPEPARLAELELTSQPSAEAALGQARSIMKGFGPPWWLAGGWAPASTAAKPWRPHLDLDVALLRRDMPVLGKHLIAWDLRVARGGRLLGWDGRGLPVSEYEVWARLLGAGRPPRRSLTARKYLYGASCRVVDAIWSQRLASDVEAPLEFRRRFPRDCADGHFHRECHALAGH